MTPALPRSCFLPALAAALALAGPAAAKPPAFSIEQVMSAPFPSPPVAARKGGRVAWVSTARGVRNVWVAEPASPGSAHQVTAYVVDDGSDLGELTWDPEGRTVYYTRGGSLEGGGPVNIMSRASGPPPQEVWAVSASEGAPRRIGAGHTPAVSPGGGRVAWLADGKVFAAETTPGAQAAELLHDRGQDSGLAWSPDGSRLAFVSTRLDHALIGVYDLKADAVVWMHPSVDTDAEPVWSPDGRRLAFIRTPTAPAFDFTTRRSGAPWSIWVGAPTTGQASPVWTATPGPGSLPFLLGETGNLRWTADDRLVFPWEKTGWVHLYSVPAAGGEARAVTPAGDYEVFNYDLSADRRGVVWSSNQGDLDHRGLWAAPAAGGKARALTVGPTLDDYPVGVGDGLVVALHGSARDPMRPVLVDPNGPRDLAQAAVPAGFPAAALVEPQGVVFPGADGLAVHGQLFLPKGERRARGPAVLFFHGGPFRQMLLGWHPMDAYAYFYAMNQYLASEGYVVLSVNYRGGTGYGLDFRQAKGFGPGGASEENDIVGAAQFLRARADVDPARLGLYGGSYGGLMTALGLSRHSDLLAVGVDYAGVHDWRGQLPNVVAPGAPAERAELAWRSSALSTVDRWRSPVLIVHADDDRSVPFAQSVQLVQALRDHGVAFQQIVIPDEIHDLLRQASWLTLFHASDSFLGEHLKP